MAEYHVISSRAEYHDAVARIAAGTGAIAVDAERASGFKYSQRAYLIQMYRRGSGTFLFDPPEIGQFDELEAAIGSEQWILHAASQDLQCLREVGLEPGTLFDTELAARLLGIPRVGLGTVVEELLGIHLAKEHSAANWSTRPIPDSWLEYAALDVELLVDLRDALIPLLEDTDKLGFAHQEFEAELAKAPKPPRAEPWRRLSGIHSIKGIRHVAVARELWLARDALARETDIAPGRLIPDAALTAAAKSMPKSKHELAATREFTGRTSRTEIDRWWNAIEVGRTTNDLPVLKGNGDSIPPPRLWHDRKPEAAIRLSQAKEKLLKRAEELSIPMENLLTPDYLRRVAWAPPESCEPQPIAEALASMGARAWQVELTVEIIRNAFVEASQIDPPTTETPS